MDWREEQHPRDQRGRFRDKAGPSGGIVDWSRLASERLGAVGGYVDEGGRFERQERLEDTIARGARKEKGRRLSGGVSASVLTYEFEMPDGSVREVLRKQYRIELPQETAAEAVAGLIGQAIGVPVPAIMRDPDDPQALYMELVEADPPHRDPTDEEAGGVEGRLIGLLDLLVYNRDRHNGNWLLLPEVWTPVGIDHGIVDLHAISVEDQEDMGRWPWSRFTAPYLDSPRGAGQGALLTHYLGDNDWHPDDLAEIDGRLRTLFTTGRYQALAAEARADEYLILERLAAIRAKATGTVRRLA